jgi:hypothetical protein
MTYREQHCDKRLALKHIQSYSTQTGVPLVFNMLLLASPKSNDPQMQIFIM